MTQADLPTGIDVPDPESGSVAAGRTAAPAPASEPPTKLLQEYEHPADRVGGIDRSRELLDIIAGMRS